MIVRTAAASSPPPASTFPLSVAPGGRYLQTASGQPFLVHGDTPWSIAVQLTRAQIDTYLDDRQAKGFNAILFNAIEHFYSDGSPAYRNAEGNVPFTTMTDFAAPNEAYWGLDDYIYNGALARGIQPFINPGYLGISGGSEGWMSEITAETAGDLQSYGAWLANRYPLAVWSAGGDYGGTTIERDKQWNIFTGIRSVNPSAIITGHGARTESAYPLWNGYTGFNLNNIYTDGTEYTYAATEYARTGPMPFVLLEGRYDGEGTAVEVRRQPYAAVLSGACGHFFGNTPIWRFGSQGVGAAASLGSLTTTGTTQMGYFRALMLAYAWEKLQPKTDTSLVTTTLGTGTSRIIPARASDGSFAMIWTPSVNFTVAMSALAPSSVRGRWYDPTTGAYSAASGSPFANTGTQAFTAPGERVLVLD